MFYYEDIVVEIGFGNGEFLLHLAEKNPDKGFLGIELSLISHRKALKKIVKKDFDNILLIKMDARIAIPFFIPDEKISAFYFNFPDPWFKRRHHKRRFFKEDMVRALYRKLKNGGFVEISTDWGEYAYEIVDSFLKVRGFKSAYPYPFFINFHPSRFKTKYERTHHLQHGDPVYYIKFFK